VIGVLAGTIEGRQILKKLCSLHVPVFGSTATSYGADLVEACPYLTMRYGPMDQAAMKEWIQANDLQLVIDATHPYAVEVTKNIGSVCKAANIPLARYERPELAVDGMTFFSDYQACIDFLSQNPGKVLLTTGSNHVDDFVKGLDPERLIVRLLPKSEVLRKCEGLGLKARQIIAMQGPFSEAMNKAMIDDYDIDYLVTKDTGRAGGLEEKTKAAIKLGVKVLCIEKEKAASDLVWESQKQLIEWVQKHI
jgi:precorrin-6A/cobalt-precorrin-6A reductase